MPPKWLINLLGKAVVKLHYARKLDLYALASEHEPELWAKSQRKAKIPGSVRWSVWRRDLFTCLYCDTWGNNLSLDHVVPETHGGKGTMDNLITACGSCNSKKGAKGFEEFINGAWLWKKRAHTTTTLTPVTSALLRQRILDRIGEEK